MRRILIALPLVLAVTACGADDDDASTTSAEPAATTPVATDAPTTTRTLTTSPVTVSGPSTTAAAVSPPVGGPSVDAAVADLAAHLDVPPTSVTVVSVEDVTWPNSAMGCPEAGMQYLQVLTEGQRIVLEADGVPYQYHAGGGRAPFRCDKPTAAVGE